MLINLSQLDKKINVTGLDRVLINHNGTPTTIYISSRTDVNGNPYLAWSLDNTTWRPFA